MALAGTRPRWLTFDCYGTLIQWDEGLLAAVDRILSSHRQHSIDARTLLAVFDRHEHALEREQPHRSFRDVAGTALQRALGELGLPADASDVDILTSSIAQMPPFPEVVPTLEFLKRAGFKLCIISNTDDDIIAGNVAQLAQTIDRVVTAEQARAYKPERAIFAYAHRALGVSIADLVHICASPVLDLTAARDIGFRCVWINRGTGRQPPPDYIPDAEMPTLAGLPHLFREAGWIDG
jgi:2-haloacid dehalogenase